MIKLTRRYIQYYKLQLTILKINVSITFYDVSPEIGIWCIYYYFILKLNVQRNCLKTIILICKLQTQNPKYYKNTFIWRLRIHMVSFDKTTFSTCIHILLCAVSIQILGDTQHVRMQAILLVESVKKLPVDLRITLEPAITWWFGLFLFESSNTCISNLAFSNSRLFLLKIKGYNVSSCGTNWAHKTIKIKSNFVIRIRTQHPVVSRRMLYHWATKVNCILSKR